MTILEYKNYLVSWLKESVENAGLDGLVVGVSGGIDSALVVNLIKEAYPNNYLGVIIPIHSSKTDVDDAYELVKQCDINHIELDLTSVFDEFASKYSYNKKESLSNTKARLRMMQLYAIASENNYLVTGTDNMCEWHTGFFTKFGDGGVDLTPLLYLTKGEVYEMAKLYNVPTSILEKQPSAGIGSNLTDEEELGVKYSEIDKYLLGIDIALSDKEIIDNIHNKTHHKRSLPQVPLKYERSILKK